MNPNKTITSRSYGLPAALALYKDLIVENLHERVFVKDVEGRFVYVSRNCAKFFGAKDPQEVIGKKDKDYFALHPAMVQSFLTDDEKVVKSGRPSGWLHELCQPDTELKPWYVSTYKAPIFATDKITNLLSSVNGAAAVRQVYADNGRNVVGVLGIFHDAIRESHIGQAQALTKTGCILWRKRTDLVDVSDSIWSIFGIPKKNRINNPLAPVGAVLERLTARIEPEDRASLLATYRKLLEDVWQRDRKDGYQPIRLKKPAIFKVAGKDQWFRLSYENSFELGNDKESQVAIVVVQDITESQTSILRLQRANQSLVLGALSRATLHDAKRPLDQIPPAVDILIASIGDLSKVSDRERDDRIQRALKILKLLKEQCVMSRNNIEHLRELSANPSQICSEKVDLVKLLMECKGTEGVVLRENGIKVCMRVKSSVRKLKHPPSVNGDKLALRVAFGNLLSNAIISGCPTGSAKKITFTIDFDALRNGLLIEIKDSGPGFPDEILRHIKEPFSVNISPRGTGFGLLIAKTLFSLMKGEFEPFAGPGARCLIFLPQNVDQSSAP